MYHSLLQTPGNQNQESLTFGMNIFQQTLTNLTAELTIDYRLWIIDYTLMKMIIGEGVKNIL